MSVLRALAVVALVLGSLLAAGILAEGLLRAWEGVWGASEEYQWDAATRWRSLHRVVEGAELLYELQPGARATIAYGKRGKITYSISAQGVRGPVREIPKPPGVSRLLILGDSVTFGYYVPEESTFAACLERELRRRYGTVEVVNGGVGGYNTHNEVVWLRERGLGFEPDVVILAFCPNDVDNPYFHFAWHTLDRLGPLPLSLLPDPAMARTQPAWPGGVWHAAKKHSRLVAVVDSRVKLLRTTLAARAARRAGDSDPRAWAALPYGDCLQALCEPSSPRLRWLENRLATLDSLASVHGFRWVLLVLPLSYQAPEGPGNCARERVKEMASGWGIPVVDPLDHGLPSGRLFYDVTHLTPAGHRWVCQALAKALAPLLDPGVGESLGERAERGCHRVGTRPWGEIMGIEGLAWAGCRRGMRPLPGAHR